MGTDEKNPNIKTNNSSGRIRILVTSFEPFKDDYNISKGVADGLVSNEKIEYIKVVLPLDYEAAKSILDRYIQDAKPDYVINLGEADENGLNARFGIKQETNAFCISSAPDKNKQSSTDCFNASEEQFAKIVKSDKLSASLQCNYNKNFQNENFDTSTFAGDNLCNFSYYTSMIAMEKIGKPGAVTFIHLSDPVHLRKSFDKVDNLTYNFGVQNYSKAIGDAFYDIADDIKNNNLDITYTNMNKEQAIAYGKENGILIKGNTIKKSENTLEEMKKIPAANIINENINENEKPPQNELLRPLLTPEDINKYTKEITKKQK